MGKKNYITAILVIISLLLINCTNRNAEIQTIKNLLNQVPAIEDSIKVVENYGKVNLMICSYKQDKNYHKIRLESRIKNYQIFNTYEIVPYDSLYLIIISNNPLTNIPQDKLTKKLLNKKMITFSGNENYVYDGPYNEFIICKNNTKNFKVFDNLISAKKQREYFEKGKTYDASIFYPECGN